MYEHHFAHAAAVLNYAESNWMDGDGQKKDIRGTLAIGGL